MLIFTLMLIPHIIFLFVFIVNTYLYTYTNTKHKDIKKICHLFFISLILLSLSTNLYTTIIYSILYISCLYMNDYLYELRRFRKNIYKN